MNIASTAVRYSLAAILATKSCSAQTRGHNNNMVAAVHVTWYVNGLRPDH
jgi:hypothetical protein